VGAAPNREGKGEAREGEQVDSYDLSLRLLPNVLTLPLYKTFTATKEEQAD